MNMIIVALALCAACAVAQTNVTYNAAAAVQWIQNQGCDNSSITNCPGGRGCNDAEFIARALAAGGVIALDPNSQTGDGYSDYFFNNKTYNLCETLYFETFLQDLGWTTPAACSAEDPNACYPQGAIGMTNNEWSQEMPIIALGGELCTSHTPTTTNGPHCAINCGEFVSTTVYFPPTPKVIGPIFGSFTPNNQTFQDLNMWINTWNSPDSAVNQAVSVLNVGWSKNDAATVVAQLNLIWETEGAVPIINWMPYPYATWANPSPNSDIAKGLYDSYIEQFLAMLQLWVAGNDGLMGSSDDRRAYLRFAPQPNGNWFPWSPICPSCSSTGQKINQTVESYVTMWKYVMKKVYATTLSKDTILTMFDVNNEDAYEMPWKAEDFYPGSAEVDWFCITGMNWGNTLPGNKWTLPAAIFSSMSARLAKLAASTPQAISTATTSHPSGAWAKYWYIPDIFDYTLKNTLVKMVIYHNADSSTDLAVFGGSGGTSQWTSPLSQVEYNVYLSFANAINNQTIYGLQGANATDIRLLSTNQFRGNF